jgi:hypothetical protein
MPENRFNPSDPFFGFLLNTAPAEQNYTTPVTGATGIFAQWIILPCQKFANSLTHYPIITLTH